MTLTALEIEEIEKNASRYGCGSHNCLACYPLVYGCVFCGLRYEQPHKNKECFTCYECGFCENCEVF